MTENRIYQINMPKWLRVLPADNPVIENAIEGIRKFTAKTKKNGEMAASPDKVFSDSPYFKSLTKGEEENVFELVPQDGLYWRVLSDLSGVDIGHENELVAYVSHAAAAKREYDKLHDALAQVEQSGYGIVNPSFENFSLEKPTLYHSGKNFGVKLRASGPSIHLVRVDVGCEVAPIIGEQNQSEEMLKFLENEYENNRQNVWETPIFGKSLESIVREDIQNKAVSMPALAKTKMQKTIGRIVNNGKGGVICILL